MASAEIQGTEDGWHALMRDRSLQFQFPDATPDAKPPNWLVQLVDFIGKHLRQIEIGAWIVLGVLVLVAAFYLGRWLLRRARQPAAAPDERAMTAWQPSAQQARLLLSDADDLAAAGRFSEAVHRLLLVAIQEIASRRPGLVVPSLTSREIASLPELSPLAQRIFFAIALVVERSRFGNRVLGAAEYSECRAAFEHFARAGTWQVAA